MTAILSASSEIIYPDSDGHPMADNTKQFRWIVTIKENLEIVFAEHPDVFVAGDLLWYPVEGNNKLRLAPDAMVAFGRPKGDRGSYRQWQEDNIAPQVVFEILSPGNRKGEMENKFEFYERYGVEEYYIYDPDNIKLKGYCRQHSELVSIDEMNGWVSPRLNIRFVMKETELEIYQPDGRKFLTFLELEEQAKGAEQRAVSAEQRAVSAEQRAVSAEHRAEQEKQRAVSAEHRAEQEKQRAERLAERLRQMGLDPDDF
ncbi:Uma2 family endonuclease [Okeania sp. SIO2G5]|uniref:Uma2 family endonuclease n=1 Tax=Okeania sp. SIO2G5 TaxID=2607796 RepID=UPI0013C2008A|nr:Uma2 family endonuclease [Okeania sp. SIO2G5]NEP76553.1 Uma2 family endonuclease [Okeania sp. SIO2G5]